MKLTEQAVSDLSDHLNKKIGQSMKDALSLMDDNSQRMFVATNAAALGFAMAARFMQVSAAEKGLTFDWPECVKGIVNHVSDLAIANPPEPLP